MDPVNLERIEIKPIELLKEAKEMLGDQYWLFVAMTFIALVIGGALPFGILMGPMMCGLFLCLMEQRKKGVADFGTLFKGFEYFAESLIATLIMMAIVMVIVTPVILLFVAGMVMGGVMLGDDGGPVLMVVSMAIFYPLLFLVSFLAQLPFLFVYPLIVGHGLKAVPAITTSWAGVKLNFMPLAIMLFVFSVLSILAALMCILPVYLLAPLTMGAMYLAYTRIFPRSLKEQIAAGEAPAKPGAQM